MRLDKYLKVSRIIKRRTIAKEACDGGRVSINGKVAKAGAREEIRSSSDALARSSRSSSGTISAHSAGP